MPNYTYTALMFEELIIRTLCDTLPDTPVDAVFLFGQTEDNEQSAFATATQLWKQYPTIKILFMGTASMSGYPGGENWKAKLIKMGVADEALELVEPIPANTDMLHTGIEAKSLVKHCLEHNYSRVIVSAAPFQQPRAFMAAASAALRHYPQMQLYSIPGKALPWQQVVTHSQGKTEGTRAELIIGEMQRIKDYSKQGDLATIEQVLHFLDQRPN